MRAAPFPHRARCLIASLATAAALALPAAAPARLAAATTHRSGGSSPGTCRSTKLSSRHPRHASRRACKTHPRKHAAPRHVASTRKAPAAPPELRAATCEDGTVPSHAGGGTYSCEDGSAPSCEAGKLVGTAAASQPMCAVKPSEKEASTPVEVSCEDPTEVNGPQGCEVATEQEALESEEESG